ncbi:hypothetical protein I546_0221 [Mycobacterium kansasii 732]|nr:hypothetical protein I546_0221 [Mycobacterium kansasii 732]
MAADTSSAPAASSPVVGAAAAAFAALRVEPMPVISLAAAASASGTAVTYDIFIRSQPYYESITALSRATLIRLITI